MKFGAHTDKLALYLSKSKSSFTNVHDPTNEPTSPSVHAQTVILQFNQYIELGWLIGSQILTQNQ